MFDIYTLIDPRNNTPFYVGYSKNRETRFKQHLREKNTRNFRKVKLLNDLVSLGFDFSDICLLEQKVDTIDEARELEILTISKYGRLDKNEGTLVNHTDGGDGTALPGKLNPMFGKDSPFKGRHHNNESKKMISEAQKNYWKAKSEDEKIELLQPLWDKAVEARLGSTHSDETKEKIRQKALGRKATENEKQVRKERMLANPSNVKQYKIVSPEGNEYLATNGLRKVCDSLDLDPAAAKSFQRLIRKGLHTAKMKSSCVYGWEVFLIS